MAIKPADNETFYREVDEELRREQMTHAWRRYGPLAVVAVILLLAAIGGWIWWEQQKQVKAGEQGETLNAVFDDVQAGKLDSVTPRLDQLAKDGAPGYRAAALLTKADLAIQTGNDSAAIAAFKTIAADESLAQPYRDLALVRQTALEFDTPRPGGGDRAAEAARGRRQSLVRQRRRNGRARPYQGRPAQARRAPVRRDGEGSGRAPKHPFARRADGGRARNRCRTASERPRRRNEGSDAMKRIGFALVMLSLLGGCSILKKGKPTTTPTVGERIAVLKGEASIEVDPALANVAVVLPPQATNAEWAQSGGNASKSMGHLSLGTALGTAWSVDAGEGSSKRERLGAPPVVANNRIYLVDTEAKLRAFDATTGASVWTSQIGTKADTAGGTDFWTGEAKGNSAALFGGGVSYDNGRVYATNGLGDAAAFDAATGAEIWKVRPGGPLRGAPTIANDNVYVVSQDNQLYALNPADGTQRWTGSGTLELAGVFGTAAPSAAQGTVVAGFSSGELTAYRFENGRVVWQDALSRTSISTVVGSLSDIDADPVIDDGRVYAVGQGGRMVAVELNTGQRIWEINIAGISTPGSRATGSSSSTIRRNCSRSPARPARSSG